MNRIACVFLLSIASLSTCVFAASPVDLIFDRGKAIPYYGAPGAQFQNLGDAIRQSQLAEKMAGLVNSTVLLKSNIGIGFDLCGHANASFDKQKGTLSICYEFIDLIAKIAHDDPKVVAMPRESFAKMFDGVLGSVFLHELGHAIIAVNGVPITGREEDVADQFSTWYSLNFVDQKKVPMIFPAVWFWTRFALLQDVQSMTEAQRKNAMSDEHSLSEQRTANVACWAFGMDPQNNGTTAQLSGLSQHRAERCSAEYLQLEAAMKHDFVRYFKVKPLSGRW